MVTELQGKLGNGACIPAMLGPGGYIRSCVLVPKEKDPVWTWLADPLLWHANRIRAPPGAICVGYACVGYAWTVSPQRVGAQ